MRDRGTFPRCFFWRRRLVELECWRPNNLQKESRRRVASRSRRSRPIVVDWAIGQSAPMVQLHPLEESTATVSVISVTAHPTFDFSLFFSVFMYLCVLWKKSCGGDRAHEHAQGFLGWYIEYYWF